MSHNLTDEQHVALAHLVSDEAAHTVEADTADQVVDAVLAGVHAGALKFKAGELPMVGYLQGLLHKLTPQIPILMPMPQPVRSVANQMLTFTGYGLRLCAPHAKLPQTLHGYEDALWNVARLMAIGFATNMAQEGFTRIFRLMTGQSSDSAELKAEKAKAKLILFLLQKAVQNNVDLRDKLKDLENLQVDYELLEDLQLSNERLEKEQRDLRDRFLAHQHNRNRIREQLEEHRSGNDSLRLGYIAGQLARATAIDGPGGKAKEENLTDSDCNTSSSRTAMEELSDQEKEEDKQDAQEEDEDDGHLADEEDIDSSPIRTVRFSTPAHTKPTHSREAISSVGRTPYHSSHLKMLDKYVADHNIGSPTPSRLLGLHPTTFTRNTEGLDASDVDDALIANKAYQQELTQKILASEQVQDVARRMTRSRSVSPTKMAMKRPFEEEVSAESSPIKRGRMKA